MQALDVTVTGNYGKLTFRQPLNTSKAKKLAEDLFSYHYPTLAGKVVPLYLKGTQGRQFQLVDTTSTGRTLMEQFPNGRRVSLPVFA